MTKTAMQMIGEARAQVGTRGTQEAADEVDRRRGASSTCVSPRSGSTGTSRGPCPHPAGCSSSSPTRPAPATRTQLDPGRRTIVVCASGARRALAAPPCKDMGYQDVAVLDGGIKAWTAAGLPTNEHEYAGI